MVNTSVGDNFKVLDDVPIVGSVDTVLLVDDVEKQEVVVLDIYQKEALNDTGLVTLGYEVLDEVSVLVLVQNIPSTNYVMDFDLYVTRVNVQDGV